MSKIVNKIDGSCFDVYLYTNNAISSRYKSLSLRSFKLVQEGVASSCQFAPVIILTALFCKVHNLFKHVLNVLPQAIRPY